MKFYSHNIDRTSYAFSVFIHLLLLFAFFLYGWYQAPQEDLIEISYGEPGGGSGGFGPIENPNQLVPKEKIGETEKIEDKGENVPEVSKSAKNDLEKIAIAKTKLAEKKVQELLSGNAKPGGTNKDGRGIGNGTGTGSGTGNGNGNGIGNGLGDGFGIDWGGAMRKIYYYSIPPYPDGVVKEIDVRLKFTIQPDGSVSNIIVVRKADATLERVAIEALKLWRFEPLPQKAKQNPQVAIITFPFRLD